MANERITEQLVDDVFRANGYRDAPEKVVVEEQQSEIAAINRILARASKAGTGRVGRPEFIVTTPDAPDMVMVIECKAALKDHESAGRDRPAGFAVDGVLHYARALAKEYTVIAVAVSGDKTLNKWDFFLINKGSTDERPLRSHAGKEITELLPFRDMVAAASFDPHVARQRESDLLAFAQEMHDFMRDEAELSEKAKPLAVAGSLIALHNKEFRDAYQAWSADKLPSFWMNSIKEEMSNALPMSDGSTKRRVPQAKQETMTQPFTAIQVHPELGKPTKAYPKGLLNEIVTRLAERVLPFLTIYEEYDVVGQFYGEFLRYTGGDQKGLGIVLTPRHITELFAHLANVQPDDMVIDPCAGTAGFLIASMAKMLGEEPREEEREKIRSERLAGVEQDPDMFAMAASNMMMRGDGRANLHQGSCFDDALSRAMKEYRPTVGMVNPPYAKSKSDLSELRFVEHMLDMLVEGGRGVAIVPMSEATGKSPYKQKLLEKHTLEAVMTMPVELFYPVGAPTVIMVFTAHKPHAASDKKTWLGYWRNDGFEIQKHMGRLDRWNQWPAIRDSWIETYRNREVHAGASVTTYLSADDEWVAEAYMETDYTDLGPDQIVEAMREYAIYKLRTSATAITGDSE